MHTDLFIDVITATADPDEPPLQSHRINWNSPRARTWLAKHMNWALNMGFSVHTRKAELG